MGIWGGKGEGILYSCHTNKLNIFVTISVSALKRSELTGQTYADLCSTIALIYINTYLTR